VALPALYPSYRDVEDLLAERGLDISYETVRSWVLKFGPVIARRLRQRRPQPSNRWHLDEMVVRIAGEHSGVALLRVHRKQIAETEMEIHEGRRGLVLLARLWRPMPDGAGEAFTLLTTEPGPYGSQYGLIDNGHRTTPCSGGVRRGR
jgi:hypothetical protein